jgi:hypothetical protein
VGIGIPQSPNAGTTATAFLIGNSELPHSPEVVEIDDLHILVDFVFQELDSSYVDQ